MIKLNKYDLYYLLGFGFLDFHTKDGVGGVFLSKHRHFFRLVEEISFKLFGRNVVSRDNNLATIFFEDEEMTSFLGQHGVLTPKRYMPTIADEYKWAFTAGYFDGYGEFSFKNDNPRTFIQSPVPSVIDYISKCWNVRTQYADKVIANGYKALDICGNMYKDVSIRNPIKLDAYLDILNINTNKREDCLKRFEYMKLHPTAIEPRKSRVSDSGYDLHIMELTKAYGNVYQGKTQIAVKPILGYAFDINGRSSLPKSGWMFMQGTGICDRSYTGGIEGTFLKLNDEPLPTLPWKALQLVPREAPIHAEFELKKDLGESDRGAGGFGSSN